MADRRRREHDDPRRLRDRSGMVVDDAIMDVENIIRRLRLARREGDPRSTAAIILDASLEVRAPIFYATLIVVLAVCRSCS